MEKAMYMQVLDIPLPGEALRLIGHEQSPPW